MSTPNTQLDITNLVLSEDHSDVAFPYTGFLLKKTAHLVVARVNEALAEWDLHIRDYMVLLLLSKLNASVPQKEIGDRLMIDRNTMVSIIDKLESLAFVSRGRDPQDRRCYAISVTDAGREFVEKAGEVATKAQHQVLAALSEDEAVTLTRLLRKVLLAAEAS